MTAATTGLSPDEGLTAGSLSIQQSGAALRQVCAEARDLYVEIAADKLAVPKEDLTIDGRADDRPRRRGHELLGAGRRQAAGQARQRRRQTQAGVGLPGGRHQRRGSTSLTSWPGGRATCTT